MDQVGWPTNINGKRELSPCYAWNNTLNGQPLLMGVSGSNADEAAQIKEGREFFNHEPPAGYYTPPAYPHPLQADEAWDTLMKSAAAHDGGASGSTTTGAASQP